MSIRKIFSRSTGSQNRRNESRKASRRQNLRKRLLGHETLEDRRLLTGYIVDTLVDQTFSGGDFATETTGPDAGLSLREAIGLANANGFPGDPMGGELDGDTITFDPALAGGVIMIDGNGELEIYDDVAIDGVDAPGLTIDGGGAVRIFYIDADGIGAMDLVEFANLTLNAGNTAGSIGSNGGAIDISPGDTVLLDTVTISNSRADDDGGGINNAGGTLTIMDSLIEFNSAVDGPSGSGGGIASSDGAVTITDTIIRANEARRAGGGIEIIDGSLDTDGMTLGGPAMADGNVAGPVGMAEPGNGGGIHVSGTADVTLVGGTVQYNQAALEGGGLWNQAGATMTLEDGVIVSDNVAAGDATHDGGGGIFNNGGTLTINGTLSPIIIEDNAATGTSGSGGGIFSTAGTVTVDSSIVRRNLANRAGGGIEIVDGMLDVAGTTIGGGPGDGNNAIGGGAGPGNGGGIHISGTTITNVTNSTISYNTAASEGGGLWNSAAGTMVLESTAGPVLVENNQAGGADADNGGGGIFNAGGDLVVDNAAGGGISISNNIADGASGSGGGIFNDAGGSLFVEAAVIDGNMAERAGGGIEDNSGGATTITLIDVLLDNNDAIGTGAAPGNGGGLHVSGDGNVDITGGTVDGNTAALEGGGLWNGTGTITIDGTIIDGNTASGDAAADDGGGGIFNSFGGTVNLLNDVAITNNIADGPTYGSGGGILNLGELTVDASDIVITGNQANRAGGGIEHNSPATLDLTNVTLDNNNAGVAPAVGAPGNGGGLHITGGADSNITGGTVSGNTAALEGGGLWNGTGTMTIDGTIIDGNTASGDGAADDGGGGIFNSAGGTVSLLNNVAIINNIADGPTYGSGGGILNLGELTVDASGTLIADNRANRAGGGIEHNSPSTLTLTNVALFGNNAGLAPAVAAPGNGGGLHITGDADSHISDSTVANNAAALEGGGLWNGTGTMTIDGATIIDGNTASGDAAADDGGGGVFNAGGTLVVNAGVSISNNEADGATNGSGGGILNDGGTLIITGALISNNSAQRAGGGIEDNGGLGSTILNSTIRGNTALGTPGRGGGIHITGAGSIDIDGTTLNNNSAQEGGGLWNSEFGTFTVTNSTISGNTATTSDGGGIFNTDGGTVDLDSVTITLNSGSGTGDGIAAGTSDVTIENTIVAQNPGGGTEANLSGTITSEDFNLIGDPDNGTVVGGTINTIFSADALLLPLTNTGGATETHLPAAGSPAIGFGSTTLTEDQRDVVRPQGGQDDIGAVEADLNGFVVDAGGQASDGNPDEILIINDAGGIGGDVEVYINGALVFSEPKATTGLIVIRGSADDDTLTVDNSNGLVGARIVFDGDGAYGAAGFPVAGGFDTLRLIGSTPVTTTYNPGETNDAGAVLQENNQVVQAIEYFGLEPLQVLAPVGGNNILNVASAPLGVGFPQALNAANAINYTEGPNSNDPFDPVFAGALTGLITVDGFESLEFANFEVLNIDAGAGSDEINLNNPVTPNELGTINVNGGDPTGGSDSVVINGTAADDTFAYTPTSTDGGTVVQGGAITMTYNLATVESLAIDAAGQAATDALTVTTANATITPGTDPGTGVVDPVSAAGNPLLSLDYAGMETATVTGTTAVVQGTAENDTITVSAAGVVTVTNELGFTNSVDVSAFGAVVINALGGDDAITIDGAAVFAGGITVLGGDNGTSSDELNLAGAAATAETVNISPSGTNGTNQTITGLGSTITVDGTELIVYDSTGGDDTLEINPDFGSTMRIDSAPRANYDRAVSDSLPEIQWTNLLLLRATPGGATNDYTTTFVTSGLFGATSYELNPQANDQTLVIEGDGNADSFTLVNPATGEVEVTDDNRGITVTSIGVGLDLLRIASLGGDDTVTVNVAPDVIDVPIEFDGGAGSDALTVTGTPATAVDEVIYSPGAAVTEGRLVYENAANATLMTIDFANLEPVIDLVPAATLTVNATNADNAVNYSQSPTNAAWGRVSVDGFETIDFAQKQNLTLNGLAGDDTVNLNNPTTPAGLTAITVNGGDPTASDTVIVNGTTGADAIVFAPTSDDDATVTGAGPVPITLATVEHAAINAQGNIGDTLTYETPAGEDHVYLTPGSTFTSGAITAQQELGTTLPLMPLSFTNLVNVFPGALAFSETGGGNTDDLHISGTQHDDVFTVDSTGLITVRSASNNLLVVPLISTAGVDQLTLRGLDGDDRFNVPGDHPYTDVNRGQLPPAALVVEGGNPDSGSDVLNFTSAGAAVTVDLGLQTVTEAGFAAVAYSGVETINADAGGVGLNVVATTEDDDVTVTVFDANSGNVEHGYTLNRLGQPISAAATPLVHYTNTGGAAVNVDLATGEDTLNVVGNALAQTFNVDVTTSTVAIDDAPVVGNDGTVTYTNNESLGVFGLEGDDTFDVTPGAIPVFIDGGDPIGESAGDTINTNAGGAAVTFEAGPENDEGGILVAGSERISYDHIEALGAIAAIKALVIGTNGDDDITVIARDASTHALADGIQDFTVSVNDGPAILFVDTPELYIDALSGDDDIVLRTPAPNDASWDVEVFVAGGAPSDGAANEGDRLVLETPGADTVIYTPTGSDTGTILIDDDNDGINDGVNGGLDSLITIGQFVCPVLNYTSDPGGVELLEYDGEGANDSLTIVAPQGNDTIVHTPGAGFDEGSLRVNTTLGIDYQNLGAAAALTVADTGGNDTLVANGTASDDAFDVAATTGAVSLVTASAAYLAINQTQVENLTLDGLDGNDDFVLNAPLPYGNINVLGGGPGGSDVLTVNGGAATDETFTVDPAFDRGDGTVSVNALLVPYVGIEHVLLEANGGDNDNLVINDDAADNRWTVDAGPVFGDRVQIDDRESIDFDSFNDVTLENGFGTDQFNVFPTQLVGFDGNFTINGDTSFGAEPVDDVLNIFGTPGDDVITSTAGVITTNGIEITPGTNLVEVSVQTLAGDDNITLALALPGVRKVVDGGVGDDNIDVSTMQDALIFGGLGDDNIIGSPLADLIYGGSGNDTISGLGGDDTIYGDEGNDTITGGTGDDSLFGGADSDLLIWNNGDNTDLMEGGTGNDRVQVNGAGGAAAGENYVISANGSRVELQRTNLVPFTLDIAQVEQLDLNTDSSADDSEVVTVNSLVGTEIEVLNLDAGPDLNNQFILNGNDSAETISIGPNEQILGLGPVINTSLVVGGAAADTITINAAGGADTITVTDTVDADLVLNGGLGDDVIDASLQQAGTLLTINGDAGDDLLRGGAGNDTINGGDGEDSMVGGLGLDTFDGGAGFDTILVEGFASDDRIDVRQDNPTTLRHEVGNTDNGFDGVLGGAETETDTLVVNTVEQVSILADAGDDTIRVAHDDSLVAAGVAANMLRFHVDGGVPGASDRLTVIDDGLGDTNVQRLGQTDGDGSFTTYAFAGGNPANAIIALPPVIYTDVEYASLNPIGPVTGGTGADGSGRLFVFKYDPFEQNQSLPTATFLGADSALNLDPNIDPGVDADFNTPGDEDWYRVVAEKTGTLDFQVYFRQQGDLDNGRAGLPGAGNLDIAVFDADGLVNGVPLAIAGNGAFGNNDADNDERVRIPAVAGQTYYLRIVGAGLPVANDVNASPAINAYNVSVVNDEPATPFDLELADNLTILTGAQEVPAVVTSSNGTANFQYDATTNTFDLDLFVAGLELADTTSQPELLFAHIHRGAVGANGPVIVTLSAGIGGWVQEPSGIRLRLDDAPFSGVAADITALLAGNTYINVHSTANPGGEVRGQILVQNVLGVSDSGRSQFDNVTQDNTPTILLRLDDALLLNDLPGNAAGVPGAMPPDQLISIPHNPSTAASPVGLTAGYRVAIYDETDTHNPVLLGFAQPIANLNGVYSFTFTTPLTDGSHFISSRVQMIDPADNDANNATLTPASGFGPRGDSLEIIVDTPPPPVSFGDAAVLGDGLHPDSDSGDPAFPATLVDRITSDTTPTFFGRAEANSIVRLYVDIDGNSIISPPDVLIGQTVAVPTDGTNQSPNGEWEITSTVNMNDPNRFAALGVDGARKILVQAEDLAGNLSGNDLAFELDIFLDTRGPQVTDVFISNRPDFDLFTLKPETPEPTPRVDSITINIQDLPARVAGFLYPAISNLAVQPNVLPLGLISVVGDHSGIIPMTSVTFISDGNLALPGNQPLAAGNPATGFITLQFADPLPDDRFTLTLSDSIIDPAGNALDGESNASEPVGTPLFPSGDGISGGDFIARFTVDSRPEVGTWSQELVYIDINGNFVWDPEGQDNDATNRDFIYHFGTTTDAYFAGNFNSNLVGPDGIFETPDDAPILPDNVPSSGFDKMGTYGRFNGLYGFFLDTNDDGIGDTVGPMFFQVNVIPVAGNFFNSTADDAAVANGQRPRDEIGGFDGQFWYLDTNGNNEIDANERFATELRGIPVVGDFNGDGNDDLATFNNDTGAFQFDLDRDGTVDDTLTFFFSGFGEKPVAGDVNLDGIDDIVLWVPNRDGQLPENAGEFHYLVSDNPGAALPSGVFNDYSPAPLGNDLIAQFGDEFALPILGNFDPPVGDIEAIDTTGWFTNLNNSLDVDNDGVVDPYDALLVINALNRGITSAEPSQAIRVRNAFNGHFLDVDGSTSIDPYDVLLIINELNRRGRAGQGEAAPSSAAAYAAAVDSVFSSDEDEDDLLLDFAENDALRNTL